MKKIFYLGVLLLPTAASFTLAPSRVVDRRKTSLAAVPGADIEQEVEEAQPQVVGNDIMYRGKVNEIDYCIAPADVSLSRAYDQSSKDTDNPAPKTLSLTRALNNASNRAVRRILLARCWPSEEALNASLRLAAKAEKQAQLERADSDAKCPVPRPILNILMRRASNNAGGPPTQKGRSSEQYVADQIVAFRDRYGSLPGYDFAEAYLESILGLATTGEESPRTKEVIEAGIYDESYKRIIAVLKSVGGVLEPIPGSNQQRISTKLNDEDLCLSVMDKIAMKREASLPPTEVASDDAETVEGETTEKKRGLFRRKDEGNGVDPLSIVLSEDAPTMTRQLNSLSNIVLRALLFGGDQELLVLSETLDNNRIPFAGRWYPETEAPGEAMEGEERPGLQYLNALILLLRKAYDDGFVTVLDPFTPLSSSYNNSYERVMAKLVELGSGYVRPVSSTIPGANVRSAKEQLGRFAVWESTFRASREDFSYPEDLEGKWEVRDEVGGEVIGVSNVVFDPQGEVKVAPPLQGLRWRLDPGPTHLDTCTFQVLSEDGTILQYRGFIDRGARLEAKVSKRPTTIRGSVMFEMRDGDMAILGEGYRKDMLPVNYKTGATKFVMTKKIAD